MLSKPFAGCCIEPIVGEVKDEACASSPDPQTTQCRAESVKWKLSAKKEGRERGGRDKAKVAGRDNNMLKESWTLSKNESLGKPVAQSYFLCRDWLEWPCVCF